MATRERIIRGTPIAFAIIADDAIYQAKDAGKNHYVTVGAIPRQ